MTRPKRKPKQPVAPPNRREMWTGIAFAAASLAAIATAMLGERVVSDARPGIGRLQWIAFAIALGCGVVAAFMLVRYRPWPVRVESAFESLGFGVGLAAAGGVVAVFGGLADGIGVGSGDFGVLQAAVVTFGLVVAAFGAAVIATARRLG
jgi:hypothetical protein